VTPDQLSALTTAIETAIESGFRNAVAAGSLGTPPAGSPPPPPPGVAPGAAPGSAPAPGGSTTVTESARVNITAQQGFLDSMATAAKKGVDATAAGFDTLAKQQNTGFIKAYDSLLENFGGQFREISSEEFLNRDFSDITNAGSRAIASSFRDFSGMLPDLLTHMNPDEASEIYEGFVSNLGQTNINLIKQLDAQTLRESAKFSKAMNISADEVGKLVSTRFAETGETSSDILTEITNQSIAVGEAAGIPFKEMAEGIKDIKLDMDTFTDMTVAGAARMTASLKQLGLSLGSFKGMMQPFRDFDTAATKMGDMSAMFGVQMDAMEMMYLANEDEEQFLHRMRDQLLDQGIDVESMSKTRQRALADQLGLGVKEMKQFMSGQIDASSAMELQSASAEGSAMDQADAMNALNDNMKVLARTTGEITQLISLMQEAFSAPGISNAIQNMGEAQSIIVKTATSTENISGKVIGIQGTIADSMSAASEGLKNMAQQLIPAADEGLTSAIEFIDSKLSTDLVANQEVFGGPKDRLKQFGKDVAPKSWPEWLHGLRDAIKYPSSPEAQAEIQEAFSQMFSSISAAFGESATLEFDGMFEQQLIDLTASVTTEADIMVQNINEALYNIEASDMEANISISVDTENIASESSAMVSEINSILSDIESPVIKAEFQPVIGSPTATLAEDVGKSIESATREIVEKFEKEPTTVEVNIDMDQIKNDIVNVIKEGLEKGFDNKPTTFRLDIEGNKLADIVAHRITTSKGERFKLIT